MAYKSFEDIGKAIRGGPKKRKRVVPQYNSPTYVPTTYSSKEIPSVRLATKVRRKKK